MGMIKEALVLNLEKKGLTNGLISGFLQNLSNYFSAEPKMDLLEINQKLQTIGWNEIQLDYHTYQLAKTWHEKEGITRRSPF